MSNQPVTTKDLIASKVTVPVSTVTKFNTNIAYLAYECEGYKYYPYEDKDDDVIKIWHEISTPRGGHIQGPWSPYVTPTLEQFVEFVTEYEDQVKSSDLAKAEKTGHWAD